MVVRCNFAISDARLRGIVGTYKSDVAVRAMRVQTYIPHALVFIALDQRLTIVLILTSNVPASLYSQPSYTHRHTYHLYPHIFSFT